MKNIKSILGISIALLVLLGVVAFAAFYGAGTAGNGNLSGSSVTDFGYYKTGTNTTITCSGATSTVLLAAASAQGMRLRFEATAVSGPITLCESALGCIYGSGSVLPASTTVNIATRFIQTSAYYGAYSCIGNGASTTVGLIYKQS